MRSSSFTIYFTSAALSWVLLGDYVWKAIHGMDDNRILPGPYKLFHFWVNGSVVKVAQTNTFIICLKLDLSPVLIFAIVVMPFLFGFLDYLFCVVYFRYLQEFGFTIPNRNIIVDDIRVRGCGHSRTSVIHNVAESYSSPPVKKVSLLRVFILSHFMAQRWVQKDGQVHFRWPYRHESSWSSFSGCPQVGEGAAASWVRQSNQFECDTD